MTTRIDKRAERIAAARRALAERYAAEPEGVDRFNARMARFSQAKRREQQRIDHLVLGKPRPKPADVGAKLVRPAGMPKTEWKVERQRRIAAGAELDPEIERAMQLRERATGAGTPETLAAAAHHADALIQLERNGTIDKEQAEWAAQIANVYRSIEADVAVKVASFEARVDQTLRGGAVGERIHRVRMHLAYTYWRQLLPAPKGLVIDMIVGDAVGYTVAAKRYGVHNRKAKRLLLEAIARWPACVAAAFSNVDQVAVDAMNDARVVSSARSARHTADRQQREPSYAQARALEAGREETDEPFLLPPVDPVFLDERGLMRPWCEIAQIVRSMVAAAGAELAVED